MLLNISLGTLSLSDYSAVGDGSHLKYYSYIHSHTLFLICVGLLSLSCYTYMMMMWIASLLSFVIRTTHTLAISLSFDVAPYLSPPMFAPPPFSV